MYDSVSTVSGENFGVEQALQLAMGYQGLSAGHEMDASFDADVEAATLCHQVKAALSLSNIGCLFIIDDKPMSFLRAEGKYLLVDSHSHGSPGALVISGSTVEGVIPCMKDIVMPVSRMGFTTGVLYSNRSPRGPAH